jgi:hypothetical protein
MSTLPSPRNVHGLLNDIHRGLGQQMYFWGVDVTSHNNLLRAYGFCRRPSPGHQGTSCYSKEWKHGLIELHGHCAGWYPPVGSGERAPGYLFVRSHQRSYAHQCSNAVIPGDYTSHQTEKDARLLFQASQHFLAWLIHYEKWVITHHGLNYRAECYRKYKALPKSSPWLRPQEALDWWQHIVSCESSFRRARRTAGRTL